MSTFGRTRYRCKIANGDGRIPGETGRRSVALEVANASGGHNLVVGAHRFFAGTDTFQYYEIVFNSRGEGEWRFAKERHYQYDVAGMEGILEWPAMHAVLAVAGLVAGGGLWLAGLLIAKLVGFVRRRKAARVF